MTPLERLKLLCEQSGISITALCLQVTGNKGNLATWKNNDGYMRSDHLSKCADILDVSTDCILGRTPLPNRFTDSIESANDSNFSAEEIHNARLKIKQLHTDNFNPTIDVIEQKTHATYQTFRTWYNGVGHFFDNKLDILADLFHVSIAELISSPEDSNINLNTDNGIDLYYQLDENDKSEIRGEMKQMLKANKYSVKTQAHQKRKPFSGVRPATIAAYGHETMGIDEKE